jgi:cytochrome c biogenesis protein CcmG/thiol:disulfide interchange protein DsbE
VSPRLAQAQKTHLFAELSHGRDRRDRHAPQRQPNPPKTAIRHPLTVVMNRPLHPSAGLLAALCAVLLAACGGSEGASTPDATAKRPDAVSKGSAAARLAKAPAALRANAADADTLAGEGEDALKARLAKLEGHPVVVNIWASWCGPCRAEFPFFADAVAEHGDKVAFLGIDFSDDRDSANRFLKEIPPGFASIYDPDGAATRSLGGGRVAPTTFFIGPDGKRVYTKLGGYADAEALEADIRRYAL